MRALVLLFLLPPGPIDAAAAGAVRFPAFRAGASCGGLDCNGNGIEDSIDIATGFSSDANLDGVPDECQEPARIARFGGSL